MRLAGLVTVVVALAACHQPSTTVTPATIWSELVDAGCVAPDEGGPASIAAQEASDAGDVWLSCMSRGGTVAACQAPCQ